jgi:hypothetical protein
VGCNLNAAQRLQVTLPLSQGGCGIKQPSTIQPAARISALSTFYTVGAKKVGVPEAISKVDSDLTTPVLHDLLEELGQNCDPLPAWTQDPDKMSSATPQYHSQKWWANMLGQAATIRLIDMSDNRNQARILEQINGIGHHWMLAVPNSNTHTAISPEEYSVGMKFWLGMPILHASARCPGCG